MSDSDSDIFCLRNGSRSTIVQVSGPNLERTMNIDFSNASAAGYMRAGNFQGHQRFGAASRGLYARRDVSPMSVRSARSDLLRADPQQNFRRPGLPQSSMVNGYSRAMSPGCESVRSIGSNVTTTDIVSALKTLKFNKYEMRDILETDFIKDACNKFMKSHVRRRIEKRRNLKFFMKGARRRSGYDSGDLASDSSISSDDCQSTRTGFTQNKNYSRYMESFKKYTHCGTSDEALSTKSNFTDIRKTIQDNSMYKDCSNHLRQHSFKNLFSLSSKNMNSTAINRTHNTTMNRATQQERFKSSFMLPSQRFTKSSIVMPIPDGSKHSEKRHIFPSSRFKKVSHSNIQKTLIETDSEDQDDNIFLQPRDKSMREHPETRRKRNLNISDYSPSYSESKKTKLSSISNSVMDCQQTETRLQVQAKEPANPEKNSEKHNNDFVFTKPCLPMRKSANPKHQDKATLQSNQPSKPVPKTNPPLILVTNINADNVKEPTNYDEQSETLQSCASDVSARPSFIKRKLFTQTLDVTESKNINQDSSPSVSPQTDVYSAITKEKTKARKLVTNQSCLSRDVLNADNNFLDLIHKLVPPDRKTATAQKTETCRNSTDTGYNSNRLTQESRWDITSLLSQCDDDKISETYTDEEIFVVRDKSKKKSVQTKTAMKDCSIAVEIPIIKEMEKKKYNKAKKPLTSVKEVHPEENKVVYSYTHNFWNIDSESDEQDLCVANTVDKSIMSQGQNKANQPNPEQKTNSKQSGTENKHETVKVIEKVKQNNKTTTAARDRPNGKINTTTATKEPKKISSKTKNVTAAKGQPNKKASVTADNVQMVLENNKGLSDISLNASKRGKGRPRKELVDRDVSENSLNTTTRSMARARKMVDTGVSDSSLNITTRSRGRPRKLVETDVSENSLNITTRSRGRPRKLVETDVSENSLGTTEREKPTKSGAAAKNNKNADKLGVMTRRRSRTNTNSPALIATKNNIANKLFKSTTKAVQSTSQGSKKVSKSAARDSSTVEQKNKATRKITNQKRMDANKENIEIDSSHNKSLRTGAPKPKFKCCDEPDENKVKHKTMPEQTLQTKNLTLKQPILRIVPLGKRLRRSTRLSK